ncbi:ATP-binding cassette domain-containing protein [Actinoallomurus bryophytorum]|uniref:Energy-coupling factor transport system ATP-binding protein n=1 Tax=Actinoallomurus bryophytorum TaxID=1490222 RepID=A0A543CCE1_9ACTN|nr:ABC transporter ATP-binding protein [Actinoallomurus bryophytorum]TQL94744.1 energy-coupling factor transport system ATP-binding protein [Actinoallomurus bryophytorum]
MIRFERVGFRYAEEAPPVLAEVDLEIDEGELCLVVGRTGTGKSTLLRAVNGLVPHFTGGILAGRLTVAGRDTRDHPPRDLADVVGYVGQDPRAGFVTDRVEEELAYGMESLGLAPAVMRRRVEETLDLLGLEGVRDRPLATLSGGQAQRVAIGSVLTAHPRVLVLDEPTSALDPVGAEDVLAILQRLVHDLGLTVVLAEHRLERVVHLADSVVLLPGDGGPVAYGPAAMIMAESPVAPPVVRLGRAAGWSPLPLSVRDARRAAAPMRDRAAVPPAGPGESRKDEPPAERGGNGRDRRTHPPAGPAVARLRRLEVRYGTVPALRGVDLAVTRGEVVALMGRNGAGKSSLLAALVGLVRPAGGHVDVLGAAPHELRAREIVRRAGLVPQDPADLLYADTVGAECRAADRDLAAPQGTCRALFERLAPDVADGTHPRDLSEGGRLSLALSVILAGRPPLVLLDEPTRGLDYTAKTRLVEILGELATGGHAIVLATHDVELAAEVATRAVVIAEGEVVADGPADEVLVSSPAFAPQMSKVFAPLPLLTVAQATAALRGPA